jgi:hypothetical protein
MTDPQFQTRADLEAWLTEARHHFNRRLAFGQPHRTIERLIRRVTAAHLHLPFEP